jgi:protein-disulfide isomerase
MRQFFYVLYLIVVFPYQSSVLASQNYIMDDVGSVVSPDQINKFDKMIYSYELQQKEQTKKDAQFAKIKNNIPKYKIQIFDAKAPGRIVLGNPRGKVIITVFTQHQCSYCQESSIVLNKIIKQHPEIQIIVIYWPFFGNDSVFTAKAVLAALQQKQAEELDRIFFSIKSFLTKDEAITIIRSIPFINSNKLLADINTKKFDKELKNNIKLAKNLELIGTPVFIFTNRAVTKFGLVLGSTVNLERDLLKILNTII